MSLICIHHGVSLAHCLALSYLASQKMLSNYSTFLAAGSGSAFNPWSFHLLNQTYLTWVGWLLAHIKRTSASYAQAVDETSQAANGFQVEIVSTHRWVDLPERKQMHCKYPVSIGSYRTPKKTSLHCYHHPISRISLHIFLQQKLSPRSVHWTKHF